MKMRIKNSLFSEPRTGDHASELLPKRARLRRRGSSLWSAGSSPRIIRFSTFELNLQTGELRQQGQKLKLQEESFLVLAALLERPGEVVTREELRGKLWPADTISCGHSGGIRHGARRSLNVS
jgi:DNA-binding response OmpR family regulator